ncbi:MAG: hypothetical protein K2G67_02655 [Muribaculaceae bacterium]|nr:hypothetical protein [Muribaculaceae bacterium]
MKKYLFLAAGMAMLSACSHKTQSVGANSATAQDNGNSNVMEVIANQAVPANEMNSRPHFARLKATLFKMSGDYSNNVAVTLGPDGSLRYFPAPSDISENSRPEEVGEGWWLNRQGLGANSVFTKWTFDEYRNLKEVPSPEEIKAAIIPGACVTEFRQLAIPAEEAREMKPSDLLLLLK